MKFFRIESARPQSGVLFMREQPNRAKTLQGMGISGKSGKNVMTKLDFSRIYRGFTLNSEFEGPHTPVNKITVKTVLRELELLIKDVR